MICINPETIFFTAFAIANNFLVLAIVDLTTGKVNEVFFNFTFKKLARNHDFGN